MPFDRVVAAVRVAADNPFLLGWSALVAVLDAATVVGLLVLVAGRSLVRATAGQLDLLPTVDGDCERVASDEETLTYATADLWELRDVDLSVTTRIRPTRTSST